MLQLSYSTINMVKEASHNWVNKLMGLKPQDRPYYHTGKAGHDIIQAHLSGKHKTPYLEHIPYTFPLVEEKDFDERLKFNVTLKSLIDRYSEFLAPSLFPKEEYNLIGFFDAMDKASCRFGEIKISSSPWGITQFANLMQRKIYSLAIPLFREVVCITAHSSVPQDLDNIVATEQWAIQKPKYYTIPCTQEDRIEALKWILEGIEIIESGDYSGGLDATGVCALGDRCYYGVNCSFK